MIIDTFDPAAVRPQPPVEPKIAEQEETRPVQGTTESLDARLDVNRGANANDGNVEERERDLDSNASTYDASGNQKDPADSPVHQESETVDIFV